MGLESEAGNGATTGAKRGVKRGKKQVVEEQREEQVEDSNVAAAGTQRCSKRKSDAVEDGKEDMPKKQSRPAEVKVDPAEEQMIRDKIAAMPTIEEARRGEFPRMMTGFINFMRRLGFLSEVSIGIYLMNVRRLYFRDSKPPEVMVSDEYRQLVRNSREDKMCSHQFSSALTKFAAFYEERAKAGRGRFTLDPVWEEEKTSKAAENKWRLAHPKPNELMSRWFQPQARPVARIAEAIPQPKKIDYTEVCGWVSIKDPTSQARIQTPVRGKNCDHVGVFDRDAYVEYNGMLSKKQFNKLSNMWNCPLCNKPAPEASLQLDTVLADALEIVRDRPEIEHLVLQPDGRLCIPETTSVPTSKCADEDESTSTPRKEQRTLTPQEEELSISTPQKEEGMSEPKEKEQESTSTPRKEEENTKTPQEQESMTTRQGASCAPETTCIPSSTCGVEEQSSPTPQKAACDPESACIQNNKCADEQESTLTPQKAPVAPSSPRSEPKQPSASRGTGNAGACGHNKDVEMFEAAQQEVQA